MSPIERGPAIGAGIGPTFIRSRANPCVHCSVIKAPGIIAGNGWTLDVPSLAIPSVYGGDFFGLGDAGCPTVRHEVIISALGGGSGAGVVVRSWNQVELVGPTPAPFSSVTLTLAQWQALGEPTDIEVWVRSYTCDDFAYTEDFAQTFVLPPLHYPLEEAAGANRVDSYGYLGPGLVPAGTVTQAAGKFGLCIYTDGIANGNYIQGSGLPWIPVSNPAGYYPRNWSLGMWHKQDNAGTFTGFGNPVYFAGVGASAPAALLMRLNWPQDAVLSGGPNCQVSDGVGVVNHQLPVHQRGVWYAIWMQASASGFAWGMVSEDGTYDEQASSATLLNETPDTFLGMHGYAAGARCSGWSDELYVWPAVLGKADILDAIGWVAP